MKDQEILANALGTYHSILVGKLKELDTQGGTINEQVAKRLRPIAERCKTLKQEARQ